MIADDVLAGDRMSMICRADTLATASSLPSGLIEKLHGFAEHSWIGTAPAVFQPDDQMNTW